MVQIIPQRSAEKGAVVFKLICDCGKDHVVKVKPSQIQFGITVMKKKTVLDHISVMPQSSFKGRQVA